MHDPSDMARRFGSLSFAVSPAGARRITKAQRTADVFLNYLPAMCALLSTLPATTTTRLFLAAACSSNPLPAKITLATPFRCSTKQRQV